MAFAKRAMGNTGSYFNEFKKWIKPAEVVDIDDDLEKNPFIQLANSLRKLGSKMTKEESDENTQIYSEGSDH